MESIFAPTPAAYNNFKSGQMEPKNTWINLTTFTKVMSKFLIHTVSIFFWFCFLTTETEQGYNPHEVDCGNFRGQSGNSQNFL
jgi:hypothetical protein